MNVEWISQLPGPIRVASYFGLQRLIGSRIGATWREFQEWTLLSPNKLNQAVAARLSHLLASATAQSAYYRHLGLTRQPGESAPQFLRRFPELTREIVREKFSDLVIDPFRDVITSPVSVARKRYDWLVVKTGGTTGVPTTVVHDACFRDWGRASRLFSQKLCGFPLSTRYFRFWGSEQDLLQQEENLDRRVLRNVLGEIPMNAFRAKECELAQHFATMQRHSEIHHLMAYVDAAVSLASYIADRKLPAPHLVSIMACAGTVIPEWRKILELTFHADVFDNYGSRECANIACECQAHTGLHIYSPNVFVEVVDEAGHACLPGQSGRILVTLLNNLTFPMIRYAIGDMGILAEPTPCPCGLPFPRLASIQGRADDMLTTEDGTLISSVFIRHFMGVSLNRQLIREWQLEQTGKHGFILRYIPLGMLGLEENLRRIKESFQKALGDRASIQMQQVNRIPSSATGKVRWVINNSNSVDPARTRSRRE